jgi:predicted nucleic acid-binding protein
VNVIFADSVYWIAITNPRDQWHETALAARERRSDADLVTTEDVLTEVLTYFGAYGPDVRRTAARIVRTILDDSEVDVIPHTSGTFMEGLALYESRLDKTYSMVDCMSMVIMRDRDIREALTNDDHFAQEGFIVLLGDNRAG